MRKWKSLAKKSIVSAASVVLIASCLGAAPIYASESNSEVPAVVEQNTPSVVAIIGKPTSDTNKSWEKNRYNLAHGTGVIVESDGVIVTNAHVVKDMKNIVVVTSNGTTYNGRATNIDEESDLALVKIDATNLHAATFGSSSDIEVGETVAAIGTPISFALRNSVTVGIVSGIDRSVNSQYQLIQTDAAINPGNSGGALINMKGEVIGINTMKYADVGVENLGFAIPVDTVKYVLNHFKLYGKVKRPYLGVELEESWEAVVGLPSSTGLRVAYVDPDSPAAEAGIKQDDLLLSVGGTSVKTMVDYNEALKKYLPNDSVEIKLQSGAESVSKTITLGEAQSSETASIDDEEGSDIDADRGKTKIGDSHYGWSMKYPSGLVKGQQSEEGDKVSFADAKGEFYLSIEVESNLSDELSPSALLNKLDGSDTQDYGASTTILERQYVKQDKAPYGKIVGRSGDNGYVQTRGYLHNGKLYTVKLYVAKEQYNNSFKQNSFNDLLDSFQLSFDSKDEALKDISVYSEDGATHTNEYGLSLDLPSGWEESSYKGGTSFYNDDYSQNVNVTVTSASSGETLKAWVERESKNFENEYVADYRKIEHPEALTLAGVPALKVAYSQTYGDDEWDAGYSLYFIKDKYKYEIDFTYPGDEDQDEVSKTLGELTSSIKVDKNLMDKELGFIQDIHELMDPDRTVTYKNDKYKYSLHVPETWTIGDAYDDKDEARKNFYFNGGNLTIQADTKESYEDLVKEEDASQKKNHDNDSEYTYSDSEVTLPSGEQAKKYVVHYSYDKKPYQETVYIFHHNHISYTATLHISDAVRTDENEARLNKAFDSIKFQDK
ncbi:trypsin-like peptidase domain-containing protein [Paenibacillus hexagrammi]|uniref:Trypsin-like peptidase domain-containing protein n=1 Tax=Paenibacillus hexagrammi TaxID=2908839 RepID=A0ABY3SJ69_9BACL|nr:trypsin-like peptidase domain-containing protein [Paenibacillus sp. YPD9-1]UJF33538.1 trypsin-like peptidase domain-containing protein [Paenibacillus sp. YPD9-1]